MIKKKLEDIEYLSNSTIIEKHNEALAKISKVDGSLMFCSFEKIFNFIALMIENKNNNEIENIHTTYNTILDIYSDISLNKKTIDKSLEVTGILNAFTFGVKTIMENGFINKNTFTKIQQIIRSNEDSIRSGVGVQINDSNGNVIWTPPQSKDEILRYLDELLVFINNDNKYPLIKMAIIHYQFEAIHPYNDGNGRTGRIINILYLIMCKVIGSPFIPLSQQIQKTKTQYYQLLQEVNKNEENITQFIIYILESISSASDASSKILLDLQLLFESIDNDNKINKELLNVFLHQELIISNKAICEKLNISSYMAKKHINELIKEKLITELGENKKTKTYILSGVMKIIKSL